MSFFFSAANEYNNGVIMTNRPLKDAELFEIRITDMIDKWAGSIEVGITAPERLTIQDSREELLDRYKQHTQHCSSCRGALKVVQRLQIMLLGYFALTVAGVALMSDTIRLPWGLPLIGMALLGLGVYSWLKFWLEPRFYFLDYVHAEKK